MPNRGELQMQRRLDTRGPSDLIDPALQCIQGVVAADKVLGRATGVPDADEQDPAVNTERGEVPSKLKVRLRGRRRRRGLELYPLGFGKRAGLHRGHQVLPRVDTQQRPLRACVERTRVHEEGLSSTS